MFSDYLSEFDDSRYVVQNLVDEYRACECPDHATFGASEGISNNESETGITHVSFVEISLLRLLAVNRRIWQLFRIYRYITR